MKHEGNIVCVRMLVFLRLFNSCKFAMLRTCRRRQHMWVWRPFNIIFKFNSKNLIYTTNNYKLP